MKVLVVLSALAACVLSAPAPSGPGLLALGYGAPWGGAILGSPWGGAIVAGPSAVSHTSLVQTHPSPVVLAHAPTVIAGPAVHAAVAPGPRSSLIVGPSGIISENQGVIAGHGLGLGLGHW